MGRGRGKGKKLTPVTSHEDSVEEVIPSYKRRGRPQKPLKDDVDEEDAEKIEEEEEEAKKEEGNDVVVSNKEIKGSAENANKTKKRDLQVKEDSDPVLEENESTKPNGFRQNGSRRKSKPRRAAEAGLEFK
ncbi:uncharacterized protein LOC109726092 [Ananas comosus]|uniref:Uncharacterized protein LOC109726092 n=1 Tax=Ananas comosus TaxID=4615 RepID=A0A6P5GZE3_ANACO|nr:uncharacterized protein LOC109726092 [Ananas comosus]